MFYNYAKMTNETSGHLQTIMITQLKSMIHTFKQVRTHRRRCRHTEVSSLYY